VMLKHFGPGNPDLPRELMDGGTGERIEG